MMAVHLYLIAVLVAVRLFVVFRDTPVPGRLALSTCGAQLLSLCVLEPNLAAGLIFAAIVCLNGLAYALEKRLAGQRELVYGRRLGMLAVSALVLTGLCIDPLNASFGPVARALVRAAGACSQLLDSLTTRHLLMLETVTIGALLAVGEAHLGVRFVIQVLRLKPGEVSTAASAAAEPEHAELSSGATVDHGVTGAAHDETEYNRGRTIGVLERLIAFGLLLESAYGALGLLIAAKGLARFRQLGDRGFAEYFLIGTLLSLTLAGVAAAGTRLLLRLLT